MLVLSRKKNESIIIGKGKDKIKIMIVDVRGDTIRLGFEAPKDVTIHREEIYKVIESEEAFSAHKDKQKS